MCCFWVLAELLTSPWFIIGEMHAFVSSGVRFLVCIRCVRIFIVICCLDYLLNVFWWILETKCLIFNSTIQYRSFRACAALNFSGSKSRRWDLALAKYSLEATICICSILFSILFRLSKIFYKIDNMCIGIVSFFTGGGGIPPYSLFRCSY